MYKRLSYAIAGTLALIVALALFGCSGGNSTAGDVEGGVAPARIAAVQVSDNGFTTTMTVNFELSDDGAPLSGVAANEIRFSVAKLITASSPSSWQSYINTTETKEAGDPGTTPDGTTAFQATAERASTDDGIFADNGDGTYSYTFSFNFRTVTDPVAVTYDPSLTHRVAMQVSDNVTNATYDFVPGNPNATPATRSIVANASCSECHERLGLHGGDRVSVDYCVTCHNPGTADANSGNTVNFTVMVHKIHFGENLQRILISSGDSTTPSMTTPTSCILRMLRTASNATTVTTRRLPMVTTGRTCPPKRHARPATRHPTTFSVLHRTRSRRRM